ncbi:mediator of RNA polymerase II transcription subunit 15a isoform X6 [Camellia sinensis]|uniref:mediator of RNA polymerase II transcription subunit 15a isoform X6 n=1 Tax=Camellia sinensis TaxID=4442 RepID=UPI001036A468|nr:mediator of RNA polymerase II transcription subunit 15a isoform X6 [Camellia sinensis]
MVFSFRSARSSEFRRRRTAQGCSQPTMDAGDWRTQLRPDSRQRIVNKIMDTLKRHLPFTGEEGLLELRKIAVRFEEKIYTAATSQMLTMENKHQNFVASSPPLNAASNITKPPHTGAAES